MMNRIGGCSACFCSAAWEVAAIGKIKRNEESNIRENRYFTKKETAKRTIKSPQLYMTIRLAIALDCSKPDFDGGYHPDVPRSDSLPLRARRNSQ
ncbi:hypothetical protein FHS26_004583 [Rhizobium pisi]|uniref:Uncharacterized protein n=1 Tax=Rhizobium pisi TaxID=574561 RepID=A0A7W5BPN8_9HYPH|nr:hypothetical protein [Rhizobium pisi]MBB3136826.1 hypothetical protein [Rhizobium pisi]